MSTCNGRCYSTQVGVSNTSWGEEEKKGLVCNIDGIVLPMRDPKEVDVPERISNLNVIQPKTKRPSGRPPKLRKLSTGEYPSNKRIVDGPTKCSRCQGTGHNKATCRAPLS